MSFQMRAVLQRPGLMILKDLRLMFAEVLKMRKIKKRNDVN